MTIGERIKCVRTEKGFTQQKFADALGLKRNTVGGYEIGTVVPSDRTIIDICDKFHVNEDWLRFGEGDMFVSRTREEEIAEFMGELIDGPNNFKKRLVSVLANLDEDGWQLLADMAEKLAREAEEEQKKNPGQE
jgi:transcriptional regulator with XRE-family HTH domain